MQLLDVPIEILCQIVSWLTDERSIYAILKTCSALYDISLRHLYTVNASSSYDKELASYWAINKNRIDILRKIYGCGIRNKSYTVFDAAIRSNSVDMVRLVKESSEVKEFGDHMRIDWLPISISYPCAVGNLAMIKLLLPSATTTSSRSIGHTVLYEGLRVAAKYGHVDIIRYLLDHDTAIVNSLNDSYDTPLHVAAQEGFVDIARLFIERGCDVNLLNLDGMTPVQLAARNGHSHTIKMLINEHNADFPIPQPPAAPEGEDTDSEGQGEILGNRLLGAVFYCQISLAEKSLDQGANIEYQRKGTWGHAKTALHIACGNGNEEMIQLLVKQGAYLQSRDGFNRTPFVTAIEGNQPDSIKVLSNLGCPIPEPEDAIWFRRIALSQAAERGHLNVIQALLDIRMDIDTADLSGTTALMTVAIHNEVNMARFLLERRADPLRAMKSQPQLTALDLAVLNQSMEVCELFLGYIKSNQQNGTSFDMSTAMRFASRSRNAKLWDLLVKYERNSWLQPDAKGRIPLHAAAIANYCQLIQLICSSSDCPTWSHDLYWSHDDSFRSHDSNTRDDDLTNKLESTDGSIVYDFDLVGDPFVSPSLNKFSLINTKDALGRTPLFLAARCGNVEAVSELQRWAASRYIAENMDISPSFAAARNGHGELLLQHFDNDSFNSVDAWGTSPFWWYSRCAETDEIRRIERLCWNAGSIDVQLQRCPEMVRERRRFVQGANWCDRCTMTVISCCYARRGSRHAFQGVPRIAAKCTICCGGEFVICEKCVVMGRSCLDSSHAKVKWEDDTLCSNCSEKAFQIKLPQTTWTVGRDTNKTMTDSGPDSLFSSPTSSLLLSSSVGPFSE